MRCYFDSSIYGYILKDKNKELILKEIKKRELVVVPSVINLYEILKTPNKRIKLELVKIYDEVRNNYDPFLPDFEILKNWFVARTKRKNKVQINYPIKINNETEESLKIMYGDTKQKERALRKARNRVQKRLILNKDNEFFKIFYDEETLSYLIKELCVALDLSLNIIKSKIVRLFLEEGSPWVYYLDSIGYEFYKRAIISKSYGKKTNPGSEDLGQCTYLIWADMFVMEDRYFYYFLKELNSLKKYNKKILNYREFKAYLGLLY